MKLKFPFSFIVILIFLLIFSLTFSSCQKMEKYGQQVTIDEIEGQAFDLIIIPGQGTREGKLIEETHENQIDVYSRLNYSLILFQTQKTKPLILLSGYAPKENVPPQEIESQVMSSLLASQLSSLGYPPEKYLILENRSHQTLENAFFCRELLPPQTKNILVLATSKSYQRTNLIFQEVFAGYNLTTASLEEQPSHKKRQELWLTFGTSLLLSLPTDYLQLKIIRLLPREAGRKILH